jgi:hypothetical protein
LQQLVDVLKRILSDLWDMENQTDFKPKPYLYKLSSLFKEEYVLGFEPQPTSASELPDIKDFATNFAKSVLEIWAGKRAPAQLSRWCMPNVYQELQNATGFQKEIGKFRNIHINEPLDGLCESAITVRFNNRLRTMTIRFEGVDHRWLCTSLDLL